MRVLIIFFGLILYTFVVGALVSVPVYELIQSLFSPDSYLGKQTFGKISNRVFMLVAATGLYPCYKLMSKKVTKDELGYNISRPDFIKAVKQGLVFGLSSLFVLAILIVVLGIRPFEDDISAGMIIKALVKASLGGFVIGLIEETFFRGIILRSMVKTIKPFWAVIITSIVFASIHFIRNKTSGVIDEMHWYSGFTYLQGSFNNYSHPKFLGSWLTLFACGVYLSFLSLHHGNIARCLGVHAGWVIVLGVVKKITDDDTSSPLNWMIGSYDKVTGYLAFFIITIICFSFWFLKYRKQPQQKS
ncbi:MAG: CPBP family intramembrane metalloprotease [Lentisphaerales bacterium]|nr:CPBP family intramembrane metalloprotease [Lentisphaerales bacterium]